MSKPGKRPMRSMTPQEKLQAIQRVHGGHSKASVARELGVPESTLRGWCKNQDKIAHQSRQPSPNSYDGSTSGGESAEKKIKLEDVTPQPYNLSKKNDHTDSISPNSDFSSADFSNASPLNLNTKMDNYKSNIASCSTSTERNKAELARLSVDLRLNQPETFLTHTNNANNFTDLTNNIGLLACTSNWNTFFQQPNFQNNFKASTTADTSSNGFFGNWALGPTTQPKAENGHKHKTHSKYSKGIDSHNALAEQFLYNYILKNPIMQGLIPCQNNLSAAIPITTASTNVNVCSSTSPNSTTSDAVKASTSTIASTSTTNVTSTTSKKKGKDNGPTFWSCMKDDSDLHRYRCSQTVQEKPILYQQLTKPNDNDNNNGDPKEGRNQLDDLLRINNNNNIIKGEDENETKEVCMSQEEALMHGRMLLKYLEHGGNPTITQLHLHQLSGILKNIKDGKEGKKNGEVQNKCKPRRK